LKQTVKPYEVIIVFKGDDLRHAEEICAQSTLNCSIIEQHEGYFTHALNLGKKNVNGDIVIFTDEDAIPNPRWVETYLKLHRSYLNAGCICSRDKYLNIEEKSAQDREAEVTKLQTYA
jgi:glycosyltransferase involved in cell wall biosynthesis